MINKVVYIGYQPLTEKVKEDFYFKNLMDKGIEVEYLDLTVIYFPNILKDQLVDNFIIKFNSFFQLEDYLKLQNMENTLFISNITFEYRVLKLYLLLSRYKCKMSFFARGALPSFYDDSKINNFIVKFSKVLKWSNLKRFVHNKYAFFLKKTGFVLPYSFVFKAGEFGLQTIGIGSNIEKEKSRIINVNSFDYDKFIDVENKEKICKNKYCVYLDEYFPFHPDFELLNIKTIDPVEFYNRLNHFFEIIENKFNIEVKIAAHPKADKYLDQDFFNNRQIFFNKTAELTSCSEFVIAHCSTSINFAILNKKPIISLTTNNIKEVMPDYHSFIVNFSKILGSNLINVDDDNLDDIAISEPNIFKYSEYKYKYLTSQDSKDLVSSEIFTEAILNI